MPQYYLIPKRLARSAPWLGKSVQWLEGQFFRLLFWSLQQLSLQRAGAIAGSLFAALGRWTDKASKADTNLAIAFPEMDLQQRRALTREIFYSLGMSSAELIQLPKIWDEEAERITLQVAPETLPILESQKSAVYVTAHVGAWQVACIPLVKRYLKQNMISVYAAESNPYLHELIYPLRIAMGADMIPNTSGVRPLMKCFNEGQSLGLVVDTRLPSGKLIPFFGQDALTNTTPARIALKGQSELIPVRARRAEPGKFHVIAEAPIRSRLSEGSADDHANDMTAQLNQRFEAWITETPGEWICLKRRWPKAHRL